MIVTGAKCALILFFSVASNTFFTSLFNFLHIREGTLAIAAPANQSQAHIRTLALVRIPAALYRWRRIWMRPQRRRVETRPPIFFLTVFHKFLPERKKAETSKRNLGSLQILHCLFHCWALLLRLLRQKKFDLLLHTLELLFFGIRERRVILQRKLAGIFNHSNLLV